MSGEVLVLAGGGTGGHLFPGLAVAEEFRRREPSRRVALIGTGRPVERRAAVAAGLELRTIAARPLRGRDALDRAKSLGSLPLAAIQSVAILRSLRPSAVVGLGGYASGPVVLAAALGSVPTAVMEQNSVPGSTNRLLARLRAVRRAYVSFPSSGRLFPEGLARPLGNPVRSEIRAARGAPLPPSPSVLVLGGSQGARRLNLAVPDALAAVAETVPALGVVHQTGDVMAEAVRRRYDEIGLHARVEPFIDDMAEAYREASIVICRAGATTVAELGVVGRPAILVPFPFAIDDHQRLNAEELARAGAGLVVADDEASSERLAELATELLGDAGRLETMAAAAASVGRPDAAERVVDDLEELIRVQR